VKTNEKLKVALLQSATVLFTHLYKAEDSRKQTFEDDGAQAAAIAREAAQLAVALWDELGAALSTPHGEAQLRS
jgi:hypothetical protein